MENKKDLTPEEMEKVSGGGKVLKGIKDKIGVLSKKVKSLISLSKVSPLVAYGAPPIKPMKDILEDKADDCKTAADKDNNIIKED